MNDDKSFWKCSVCGDAVLARNYGALTCKSCKPFFRRNVNKHGTFSCKFGGQCKITMTTRKKCRKCRLDKCFAVGMRPELIMDDVDKHFRRSLLEAKKRMRLAMEEPAHTEMDRDDSYRVIQYSSSPDSPGARTDQSHDTDDYRAVEYSSSPAEYGNSESSPQNSSDDSYRAIEYSSSPVTPIRVSSDERQTFDGQQTPPVVTVQALEPIHYNEEEQEKVVNDDEINEMIDMIRINDIVQSSVDSYKPTLDLVSQGLVIYRPINDYINGFNAQENHKLQELFEVLRPLDSHFGLNAMFYEVRNVMEMVHMMNLDYEREITKFITNVKRIGEFAEVCENDKIAMVKSSCLDILILRSLHLYDHSRDAWILPIDQNNWFILKMDFLKVLARTASATYKTNLLGLTEIIQEYDSDSVIIDLLTAIALFNPNRSAIMCKDKIGAQQRVYIYLLQRYLQYKYRSAAESSAKLSKLFNTLIFSRILAEWEKKYFVEDYSEGYSPLVREIFDVSVGTGVGL